MTSAHQVRFGIAAGVFAALATVSGCLCGGGTSAGDCTGNIGGVAFNVSIDEADSSFHVAYVNSGRTSRDLDVAKMSFGGGRLVMHSESFRTSVLAASGPRPLPTTEVPECQQTSGSDAGTDAGSDAGTDAGAGADAGAGTDAGATDAGVTCARPRTPSEPYVTKFVIEAPPASDRPRLLEGTAAFSLRGDAALHVVLSLVFEDASALACDFTLRHDFDADEGSVPSRSGGGSDFDGDGD